MESSQPGENQLPRGDAEQAFAGRSAPSPGVEALQQEVLRLQQALVESRKSEQLLAGLIESAMDAIISVDERHRIVQFNPAAERMFGLPAAEALGQSIETLLPEDARQDRKSVV